MPDRRLLPRIALLALLALGMAGAPGAAAPGPVCDSGTPLTLLGIDTSSGETLISIPAPGGHGHQGHPWIVELSGDGRRARLHPDRSQGRFGGSVGPGPVLAFSRCGEGCLQAVRWAGGVWEPVGDPLHIPSATTITPTYDQTGAPWIAVQFPTEEDGRVRVHAIRLEGREWQSRGEMKVTGLGQPAALPAPQRKDGILVGTGLFSASGRPEPWVAGFPNLPPERRGQVLALTGTTAAYVSGDGAVYLSEDGGRAWRRSTWTPWGGSEWTVGLWRQGSDWWVDLPYGDSAGALRLAWFDRRVPGEEKIILTRLTESGRWVQLAEARSEVTTRNESLPLSQLLVPRQDSWILLSGCVGLGGAGDSGLVLRTFEGGALSSPRLVPLAPAAP